MDYLDSIQNPQDLQGLTIPQLEELAGEIRQLLIDTVAQQGGHLAPNLGVVELTLALHRVFHTPQDKIVFDVGHQAYVHKILTGRRQAFGTLRALGGISGFPNRAESPHDAFGTGHASTSISAALGLARARDLLGQKHHVVAVVGDGALTGGMCYEALNEAGNAARRLIVVLNDNEMSISRNVGGLSRHLTNLRGSRSWRGTKLAVKGGLVRIPRIGPRLAVWLENFKNTLKHFFVSGEFFESLGFRYLGPINGHDLGTLIRVLESAKGVEDTPLLIHVVTQKGRGYERAERKPDQFHGVAPFLLETGLAKEASDTPTFSDVAVSALADLAQSDPRVVAITAAMRLGTGLTPFETRFPDRFFDVGIAEEHAVTLAAGMACGGLRPFFAVYSTFLQRGYDQLLHDVCLQNLPVCLLIDRAGLVGEDGATHHGVFDLAYLRHMPGMRIFAPRDARELQAMLPAVMALDAPCAIRYARDAAAWEGEGIPLSGGFTPGVWEPLGPLPAQAALLTFGRMVWAALAAAALLAARGIAVTVINASTIKPLDEELLGRLDALGVPAITVEEHALAGGFGEMVTACCQAKGWAVPRLCFGIGDAFVPHGAVDLLLDRCGLTAPQIADRVAEALA
ncbi:MAG: 1-deoxy-D-xylulose-5-phosphate synthase [Oscillospiraceae bacterium]|jgi:1-deoxy-D-xylulose-5-phosphate synthase|nr:1-deoxy-D-xylulose-5-phosphate synthase [Oscillospiraceae bacterium]